jgi:hypothetical protein
MVSPLLDIFVQYGGAAIAGIAVGLLSKVFFARQIQGKIRGYQSEIVKSHSKILLLESQNDRLEKRVKELEGQFSKERLFMN